jgi:GTPase Era involved in 16S rRNA processing
MKAKLKKFKTNYDLFVVNEDNQIETFASTDNTFVYKLSKQNCDEIFGVVNVEKLAGDYANERLNEEYSSSAGNFQAFSSSFREGFNKAMELNKDKVFTLEQMKRIYEKGYSSGRSELNSRESDKIKYDYIQSLQQPTEIEVEIVMEDVIQLKKRAGGITNMGKPKLDSEGCLILKRIV